MLSLMCRLMSSNESRLPCLVNSTRLQTQEHKHYYDRSGEIQDRDQCKSTNKIRDHARINEYYNDQTW